MSERAERKVITRKFFITKEELNISPDLPFYEIDEDEVISALDPVTYEVVSHRLWAINDEMAKTIERVSGSPVVSIAGDFNVVITDPCGDVVCTGMYVQWHSGILDSMIKNVLSTRSYEPGIHEGDMFLINDPYRGGGHQNDVALVAPHFHDGKLFCWTGSILHQMDLGGVDFGSVCLHAKDVHDEPTPIPGVRIVEGGKLRQDLLEWYLRPSRLPWLVELDLRAQIAGNVAGERRMREIINKYGPDTTMGILKRLLRDAESLFRQRLREIPDGSWAGVEYIEKAREGDGNVYRVQCTLTKKGDEMVFDTRGSDYYPLGHGVVNITYGALRGCILTFILPMICYDMPWATGGISKAITLVSEKGSIVDAEWPAPVSAIGACASFLGQNLAQETITKMLCASPKYRKELISPHFGTWCFLMSSSTDQYGLPWISFWMDPLCACIGARSFRDGGDTAGAFCIATAKTPEIEQNELTAPVLYLYRKEKKDSAGAGKYRGGCGLEWCIIPHGTDKIEHITLALFAAHGAADGLCGGYPGGPIRLVRKEKTNIDEWLRRGKIPSDIMEEDLTGEFKFVDFKGAFTQEKDTVFALTTCGASGYGDPLERDPELVKKDVINEYVSLNVARRIYGVVLDPKTLDINWEETEQLREKVLQERAR